MKLDIAIQIIQILSNATDFQNKNIFEALMDTDFPFVPLIQRLLEWILLNYNNTKSKSSPAGTRIYTLCQNLEQLLTKVNASDQVVRQCLPILMTTVLQIDKKLRVLVKMNSLNSERAVSIQKNVNVLFLSLFKSWMQSDKIAKLFLNELNGFDFLLDRLFSKTVAKSRVNRKKAIMHEGLIEEDVQGMLNQLAQQWNHPIGPVVAPSTSNTAANAATNQDQKLPLGEMPPIMKKQTAIQPDEAVVLEQLGEKTDLESQLQAEDFGRQLKLIWSSDQQKGTTNAFGEIQWSVFKNGTKNRVFNYVINNIDHQYEYVMKFDLQTNIQISELQIGLLYNFSIYEQDAQYEPLSFIVEGGKVQDDPEWKMLLSSVEDGGYKLNGISVYGCNFVEQADHDIASTLEHKLESIGCKECRYLTFRLRKPLMSCLDSSTYVSCTNKPKSYGISYISVMGIESNNKKVYPFILDLQKENSLEVLSKFFSGEFTEAFETIAEQPVIVEKIKATFDKLSSLLDTKASLIKPIFLALCAKNTDLSNWITTNRLLSLDYTKIKSEQIKFLGEIISSNKIDIRSLSLDCQSPMNRGSRQFLHFGQQKLDNLCMNMLLKLDKLKAFLLNQIKQITRGYITLSEGQKILLSRFFKLYTEKLRDFAQIVMATTESLPQEVEKYSEFIARFELEDINSTISILNKFGEGNSKLAAALTNFALLLLIPPQPLFNKVIKVNQYVETILQEENHQLQNLLLCSIISSIHASVIKIIIKYNKIDYIVQQLQSYSEDKKNGASSDMILTCLTILHNCSKQQYFRDQYCETLTFTLYELLKSNKENKLLRGDYSTLQVDILVSTIKELAVRSETSQEKLSNLLKQDITIASEKGDIEFINRVIVSILHAEEKVALSFSIFDNADPSNKIQPIHQNSDTTAKGPQFFLNTDVLNQKQKDAFTKSFKDISGDKVENYQKLLESKWELVYEDKQQTQDAAKFKRFIQGTQNKSNLIILLSCTVNGQKAVFGGYTCKPFPAMGSTWQHEFDYQIPYGDGSFVFYYNPSKELHFTMSDKKPFGYIYTDYEEGGALSISGDFFLISWSYEFQSSCGNIYSMKCIEDPSIMTFYSNMDILQTEIWWCNTAVKGQTSGGKLKSELKKSPAYQALTPFNYFNNNLIFDLNAAMTLDQACMEIFGQTYKFIDLPSQDPISGDTQILQLYIEKAAENCVLDLFIQKTQGSQEDQKEEVQMEEKTGLFSKSDLKTDTAKGQQTNQKEEEVNSENKDSNTDGKKVPEKELAKPQVQDSKALFIPSQPILKKFDAKGGIYDLITAAKVVVARYNNDKLKELWSLWLQEIEAFSQLPSYFQIFSLNKEKEATIYNLLEQKYDTDKESGDASYQKILNEQEELHIDMVKYSYQIVNQVFEQHQGADLRDQCLQNGTLERFIERIGQLSSEKKRIKIDQVNPLIASEQTSPKDQYEEDSSQTKPADQDDSIDKKLRKGVGYTNGVGTAWNVNEYLKSREAKSAQITNIVNILRHVLKSKDWQVPAQVKDLLLESSLLPTLESALRSGSLLEMAKDFELNMAYLDFIQEIAEHDMLIEILLDIGDQYEPRQKEPIFKLLEKLNDLSSIFLACLPEEQPKNSDEQAEKPKLLAQKIEQTQEIVKDKIQTQSSLKQIQSLKEVMNLPLELAYHKLLADLRFDYMSMKAKAGVYTHAYVSELAANATPAIPKLVRLAQEIADLSNSLPCEYTNGVFCRVDKERVDMMRCCIMGASDTPYAHGAFIYDLFFDNQYPNSSPKCLLMTTGGQTVRFNPNLYHNGKVCLSLLGTWRGFATENWDPKLSTILQVLLSIQSIIMSNEVYFNEPGYEHEAGTPEGELKNEGYANIVRYCNIKFAIIEQIKNPPEGFEKVIKRNFYLKKNVILRDVKKWVDDAKVSKAIYKGLVYDHNYQWAPQISPEGKYAELMEAIYIELQEALDSIPSPFEDDITGMKLERKFSKNEEEQKTQSAANGGQTDKGVTFEQSALQLEEIDVSYEPINANESTQQSINIDDEKVKDRWSRYIGAMGIEAVAKQAESRILLVGLGSLGIEIAKNLVLAGCKELIIFDDSLPLMSDLGNGQFYLTEQDVKSKTRIDQCCKDKIQQLNFYVKVSTVPEGKGWFEFLSSSSELKVVIVSKTLNISDAQRIYEANTVCKKKGFNFIHSSQDGLFGRMFNYFGEDMVVVDPNGEEMQEVLISEITNDGEGGVVTLLQGHKHKFQDGDKVMFSEVLGDLSESSINGTVHEVKVISPSQFRIGDTSSYGKSLTSGIAKQIRVPQTIHFVALQDQKKGESEKVFDQNLILSDFEKIDNFKFGHWCYQALFDVLHADQPKLLNSLAENYHEFYNVYLSKYLEEGMDEKLTKKFKLYSLIFALTSKHSLGPISAYLGGIVAQAAIKAITQKFMPIKQFYYFDALELFSGLESLDVSNKEEVCKFIEQRNSLESNEVDETSRDMGLKICLGEQLLKKIQQCNLFMIGAGAIGCELLKNYALLGLGSSAKGGITITDPDVIEISNLNRQFLFREKHLRKPKSQIAAAASIQMNPQMKGHINARLDKIHEGTSNIYTEDFFKGQTIVTNALDNVAARLYIDKRCVSARVALIDSGTLGPKGHVQIVIPMKSESYGSQNDPEDNTEIPHCTLKMFPEETLHCVEWAKDIFGSYFSLNPQSYNKFMYGEDTMGPINFNDQQELVALKKVIKLEKNRPKNFGECALMARIWFQKYFYNDVLQLLHVYPADKQMKDGKLFWALPKRPPVPIVFDPQNVLHATFIQSTACLLATMFQIDIPLSLSTRNNEAKLAIAQSSTKADVPKFVPNDIKASQIESKVDKEKQKLLSEEPELDQQQQESQQPKHNVEQLKEAYDKVIKPVKDQNETSKKLVVQEFEKDVDVNFHVDFIYSMANIRATNYKLSEMDWLTVKIKAGRIVPALATTTAAIAGLQTLEVLKYLKNCKFEEHRNSFLNLAVPSLMMSEPAPAAKIKIIEGLEVTLWDIWEINDAKENITLLQIVQHFEKQHPGLKGNDIFYGSIPLFINAIQGRTPENRKKNLDQPLLKLIHKEKADGYVELTITFVVSGESEERLIEGTPAVRVNFSKKA